ncbi:MAG: OsmC family protein, partial [Terracidiphilus sp.]
MIAHSEWKQDSQFEGIAENGNTILFDADAAHTHGPSPMEAVLMALCACTSVDVVSILKKKRQPLTGLRVSAVAEQSPA